MNERHSSRLRKHCGIEYQLERPLGDFYRERLLAHLDDSYLGIRMRKFPEDLRTYEELLWEGRVDTVIEVGLGQGGSALWFRDRLQSFAGYGAAEQVVVVSLDVDISEGRRNLERVDSNYAETIRLIEADVRDEAVADLVRAHMRSDARVMVVDDSAHTYDTTLATLLHLSSFVAVSGYVVIEDGHRYIPELLPETMSVGDGPGAIRAVEDWLATDGNGRFQLRRDQERYIVTSHPRGFLQRVS